MLGRIELNSIVEIRYKGWEETLRIVPLRATCEIEGFDYPRQISRKLRCSGRSG